MKQLLCVISALLILCLSSVNALAYSYNDLPTITVEPISLSSISIKPLTSELRVGETRTLKVTYNPTNASNKNILWSSSNPNIVSVESSSGIITANKVGTTTITATSQDGNRTNNIVIEVKPYFGFASIEKPVLSLGPSEAFFIPYAVRVTLNVRYTISEKIGNQVKIDSISAFAKYDKPNPIEGLSYPSLIVPTIMLNNETLSHSPDQGDHITAPEWVWVDHIAQVNKFVALGSQLSVTALIMMHGAIDLSSSIVLNTTINC
jgi:hypothetical protein